MINPEYIEDFVGFYPGTHFWIDRVLDWNSDEAAKRLSGMTAEIGYMKDAQSFKAAVTIEGLVLLHIGKLASTRPHMGIPAEREAAVQWWDEYLDHIHALQILFETVSLRQGHAYNYVSVVELTPEDTCTFGMFEWQPVRGNHSNGRTMLSDRFAARDWLRHKAEMFTPKEVTDHWSFNYVTLSIANLDEIFSNFEALTAHPIKIKWFSFIAKSKTAFGRGDFRVAFMLSWFVIESACIDTYYSLNPSVPRPTATTTNHVTMHVAQQDIFAKQAIDQNTFDAINQLRKIRNKLIHQPHQTICTQNDSIKAHDTALKFACANLNFGVNMLLTHNVKY